MPEKRTVKNEIKDIWKSNLNKVLLIIAAFLFLVLILINPLLNGLLKPELEKSLNESKNINGSIEDISYNIITGVYSVNNFNIRSADTSGTSDSMEVNIPLIEISDLNTLKLAFGGGLSFNNITINDPSGFIKRKSANNQSGNKSQNKGESNILFLAGILKSMPERLKPLNFNEFSIKTLNFKQEIRDSIYSDTVKTIYLKFNNMLFDSSAVSDSLFLKYADNAELTIEGVKYHFKNDYLLKLDKLYLSSSDSVFRITNINYEPYMSDDRYFSHRQYSSDRYLINSPLVELSGIDFSQLIWQNNYFADNVYIKDIYLNILTNSIAPVNPGSDPQMPHELIQSAEGKINIRNFNIENSEIHVKGRHLYSKQYSDVVFKNIKAEIKNISNIPEEQANNPCTINASANLYGKGKLSVVVNLPLLSDDLSFNYKGYLDSMSVLPINKQLLYSDHVELTSGEIKSVDFSVHVTNAAADVYIRPIYSNLKIKKLDKKNISEEQNISSFIANTFIIRHNNPDDSGKLKAGTIIYLKKEKDTFFDLIWTAVKTGLGEVAGF